MSDNYSIVKSTISKTMIRCMSEHSLRNALCYVISFLCLHFVIEEEMNENDYKLLTNDAKNTA